jgi:hypothetical protein
MVAVHPPLVAYLSQERADHLADAGLFADDPPGDGNRVASAGRDVGDDRREGAAAA